MSGGSRVSGEGARVSKWGGTGTGISIPFFCRYCWNSPGSLQFIDSVVLLPCYTCLSTLGLGRCVVNMYPGIAPLCDTCLSPWALRDNCLPGAQMGVGE